MRICRFCHVEIETINGQWVTTDPDSSFYYLFCPNNVIGLHRPFDRTDAIIALTWIYGELS